MSSEEELPIAQSYAYYKGGGIYNIISVFDWNGKCLKHFSLKGMESQQIGIKQKQMDKDAYNDI